MIKNSMLKNCHTFMILAYKESPYLTDCILSLLNQTVKSDIFISTSTPSVFLSRISEKFNIPLIVNKNSAGIASDWSFAYKNAMTKYVTLAHQDDLYLPRYAEACLAAAERCRNNNLIVFTDYSELLQDGAVGINTNLFIKKALLLPFLFKRNLASPFIKKCILYFGSPISCPSIVYNKENIGTFAFLNEFKVSLDWEAWLRLIRLRGSFIYINKKLMYHRIHKSSASSLYIKNKIRKQEDDIIFSGLWPKTIANFLAGLYYFSSRSNEVKIHRKAKLGVLAKDKIYISPLKRKLSKRDIK